MRSGWRQRPARRTGGPAWSRRSARALSDVDALYTKPPREPGAQPHPHVPYGDELDGVEFGEAGRDRRRHRGSGDQGRRGPACGRRAAPVLLAATADVAAALAGADIGTWFAADPAQQGAEIAAAPG